MALPKLAELAVAIPVEALDGVLKGVQFGSKHCSTDCFVFRVRNRFYLVACGGKNISPSTDTASIDTARD